MTEHRDDLVLALRDLGEHLDLPAVDPVALAVGRIRTPEAVPPKRWSPPRPLLGGKRVLVAAAVVLVVLTAVLAAPGSRHAVADWLGIGSVRVTYTGEVPDDAGRAYDLGTPVPLANAADQASWPLMSPVGAGDPDRAFVDRPPGSVTLVWAASDELPEVGDSGIGLLLGALPGTTDTGAVSKHAGPGTTVELVRLGDGPAYWIAGEPHELLIADPEGRIVTDVTRLAGNTLIWTDGDITYRLESDLDRNAAIDLATSLRPLHP